MDHLTKSAGEMMRLLRRRRNLTLAQAARLLLTSSPVLSRKERGAAPLERSDLQAAIGAYALDPWESYQLITAAGFLPGSFALTDSSGGLRRFAESILANLTYPAFITDELMYIRAWNQPIHAIWTPNLDGRPLHLLDDLFSGRVRAKMGDGWHAYMERALRIFQLKTLHVRPRADYAQLLRELGRKHGPDFARVWAAADILTQEAVAGQVARTGTETVIVRHDSPAGMIDYLVAEATWHFPQPYSLSVYVPYGAANTARFAEFLARMGPNELYFAGDPP